MLLRLPRSTRTDSLFPYSALFLADVRPLDFKTMVAGWATVTRHRRAAGYMIASGMMQGALYGYLNSSEQIIAEVFGARTLFPLIFACVAVGIAIANFSNAAIVERFGEIGRAHV